MQLILEGADEHEIACVYCHWQGKASDLTKGDYFVLTNITELHCPACTKYLGFIQHDSHQDDKKDPLTG
jgi:hypothetical protein